MSLKNTIDIQIKESMLNKNKSRLVALRAIKAAILVEEKSGISKEINEIQLLMKLIKQRKDSLALYLEQNRDDLAKVEKEEIEIIEEFLPNQLSDDELYKEITSIIKDLGASKIRDFQIAKKLINSNSPLSKSEQTLIKKLAQHSKERLGNTFCGQCRDCLPCPNEIPIPEILRLRNLCIGMDLNSFTKERYNLIGSCLLYTSDAADE